MLDATDFKKVASGGFGDRHNSYAWSMEWFKGQLYVGTNRDLLWQFRKFGHFSYLDPCPVPLPPLPEMDLRAQIWRYTPKAGKWEQVYTSLLMTRSLWRKVVRIRRTSRAVRRGPAQKRRRQTRWINRRRAWVLLRETLRLGYQWAKSGFKPVARDLGYRTMVVHTDRHGNDELYVAALGPGGSLLRTTDGATFDVTVGVPLRPMVSFRGRVYASPVSAHFSKLPAVLESDDPTGGGMDSPQMWRLASAPGFGDPDNATIFEMAVFKDHHREDIHSIVPAPPPKARLSD